MSIIDSLNDLQNNLNTAKQVLVDNISAKGVSVTTADTLTDIANSVLDIPQEGGGGELDWMAIGYGTTPSIITDGYTYAEAIKRDWNDIETNRFGAFQEDKKLLFFPDVDTTNITNMQQMFWNSSVATIPSTFNVNSATSLYGIFNGCTNLKELDVSNWRTDNVTNMGTMFGSTQIETLDVSHWNTENVKNMSQAFYQTKVKELDLSGWNVGQVTMMNSMFQNAVNLETLKLSGWNTSSVTNMSSMFGGCSGLTSLDLSGWDMSSVTDIGYMFSDCTSLIELDLSKWNLASPYYYGLFLNCSALQSIKMCYCDTETQNKINDALSLAGLTSQVTIITDCPTPLSFEFDGEYVVYKLNNDSYTARTSPYETTLSDLGISELTNLSGMFYGQTNLTQVNSIPSTDMVTDMTQMFAECRALKDIDLSKIKANEVTSMKYMFNNCTSVETINLSGWDMSNVTDMGFCFSNCEKLRILDWSNITLGSSFPNIQGIFTNCNNLEEIRMYGCDPTLIATLKENLPYFASIDVNIIKY